MKEGLGGLRKWVASRGSGTIAQLIKFEFFYLTLKILVGFSFWFSSLETKFLTDWCQYFPLIGGYS